MNPEFLESNNLGSEGREVLPVEGEKLPQDIVKKIESFSKREGEIAMTPLISEQVEILLVRSGAKPTGNIEIYGGYEEVGIKKFGKNYHNILAKETMQIENFLKSIGLCYRMTEPEMYEAKNKEGKVTTRQEKRHVYIGKDEKALNAIWDADSDEEVGLAYGFPRTAVEAFCGKIEKISSSELPEEIKKSDAFFFIDFFLSRDNWREEIKVPEAWARTLKKNSPKLFNEMIRKIEK